MAATGITVPLQVQVTIELTGRMLPGTEIAAALCALEAMRPDVIGINCATGPVEMYEPLRHLTGHSTTPVSALPNAGLPSVVEGRMHYDLTPDQLAEHLHRFATELGVSVIGGCCGTTPAHLDAVVRRCRGAAGGPPGRRARGRRGVALQLRPLRPGALLPRHRRAHERQRLEALPRGDARRAIATRRPPWPATRYGRERTSSTSASTTPAPTGSPTWAEVACRFATQSTAPVVIDSTEAAVVRDRARAGSAGAPSSTR